jgi:dTDP-4-amino-4,6-dideoxygalactose transaminase
MHADVPFVDLSRQHLPLLPELTHATQRVLESGQFNGGPEVASFEQEFGAYLGTPQVVAVSTGTSALHLALRALDLRSTDEVIVPANSFVATAEAVVLAGARPVFCDVERATGLASRRTMEAVMSPRTRALIPVHLYGNVADMDPILDLAEAHRLFVIEDAAQAHGARYRGRGGAGRRAGSIGHAGCFSFYPTKNLGAAGEGGAVATHDRRLAERIRMLRDHGQRDKHVHELVGDNARLASIQAAVLRIKLRHLDDWNARRRAVASRFHEHLGTLPVTPIAVPTWSESVFHLNVITTSARDRVRAGLSSMGIASAVHYPTPIHLQPAFAAYSGGPGSLPACEALAGEILSLPMFPELTSEEVDRTLSALTSVLHQVATEPIGLAVR